jgi:hypothetical protein
MNKEIKDRIKLIGDLEGINPSCDNCIYKENNASIGSITVINGMISKEKDSVYLFVCEGMKDSFIYQIVSKNKYIKKRNPFSETWFFKHGFHCLICNYWERENNE